MRPALTIVPDGNLSEDPSWSELIELVKECKVLAILEGKPVELFFQNRSERRGNDNAALMVESQGKLVAWSSERTFKRALQVVRKKLRTRIQERDDEERRAASKPGSGEASRQGPRRARSEGKRSK